MTSLGTGTLSRRRLALPVLLAVLALLVGSQLTPGANAEKIPANGVSIASRVQAQKDLCDVGGGTFESTQTAFGSTITTCTGGDGGAGTCVNTEQSTNCHPPLTRGDVDVYTPPTGGVYDEPVPGGTQTGNVVGATTDGQLARAAADDDSDDRAMRKDKSKKQKNMNKSKKGKAGGKRRK